MTQELFHPLAPIPAYFRIEENPGFERFDRIIILMDIAGGITDPTGHAIEIEVDAVLFHTGDEIIDPI